MGSSRSGATGTGPKADLIACPLLCPTSPVNLVLSGHEEQQTALVANSCLKDQPTGGQWKARRERQFPQLHWVVENKVGSH